MKKIIYIDMDDVMCDYSGAHKEALALNSEIKYPQSQPNFFRELKPITGAIEAVKRLCLNDKYEVYILTAPSVKNPLCYTEKRLWIEDYFGIKMVEKLIITSNKGLNKGDYLIDDYVSGKGQENFEGRLIHFGSEEFSDWMAIIKYFTMQHRKDSL